MGRRRGSLASSVLLAASIFEAGVPLVRNIVLARLMIPSEFGLAITLAVVISLVEILTDLGIPILALRRLNGIGARETLATLHSLALARSLLIGLFLIATAPLIARSLHVPAATWAFAALGAVAALRGFENLGVKSMLRANQFSPEASVIAVSQVALLVVTVAAAWWTGRYDCILWGMLADDSGRWFVSCGIAPPLAVGVQSRGYKGSFAIWSPSSYRRCCCVGRYERQVDCGSGFGPCGHCRL